MLALLLQHIAHALNAYVLNKACDTTMAKRPRAERRRMQQEDDSGDEFSDVDEELEASDVDDEAPSSDDDDAGEYAAALAELGAARRKAGVAGEDEDDDDGVHSDSDDEAFEAVVERTTKKGATVYQVTLCPETAPFTTRAAADEFMRGKAYQKAVKRELRAIKAARKGLREAELTDAQKARRDAKAARAKERRRAQAKARKKAKPLSEAQIAARKEKFQRKKKRRAERAAAAAA